MTLSPQRLFKLAHGPAGHPHTDAASALLDAMPDKDRRVSTHVPVNTIDADHRGLHRAYLVLCHGEERLDHDLAKGLGRMYPAMLASGDSRLHVTVPKDRNHQIRLYQKCEVERVVRGLDERNKTYKKDLLRMLSVEESAQADGVFTENAPTRLWHNLYAALLAAYPDYQVAEHKTLEWMKQLFEVCSVGSTKDSASEEWLRSARLINRIFEVNVTPSSTLELLSGWTAGMISRRITLPEQEAASLSLDALLFCLKYHDFYPNRPLIQFAAELTIVMMQVTYEFASIYDGYRSNRSESLTKIIKGYFEHVFDRTYGKNENLFWGFAFGNQYVLSSEVDHSSLQPIDESASLMQLIDQQFDSALRDRETLGDFGKPYVVHMRLPDEYGVISNYINRVLRSRILAAQEVGHKIEGFIVTSPNGYTVFHGPEILKSSLPDGRDHHPDASEDDEG